MYPTVVSLLDDQKRFFSLFGTKLARNQQEKDPKFLPCLGFPKQFPNQILNFGLLCQFSHLRFFLHLRQKYIIFLFSWLSEK